MGIVNVTPDSFSDGGRHLDPARAVRHGLDLLRAGADLLDVGGESTRPGAAAVPADAELDRVMPVVTGLVRRGAVVSVDTSKAEVAAAALEAGAAAINDITALGDPEMASVVAEAGAGLVLMHMQGTPATMQDDPRYDDVVAEVRDFLVERAGRARAAGVAADRICIDPGIGFGKTTEHNLALLGHLDVLVATGHPVLVGASRKAFLARLLGDLDETGRDEATAVVTAWAAAAGAAVVRVHDVARSLRAAQLATAIVQQRSGRQV